MCRNMIQITINEDLEFQVLYKMMMLKSYLIQIGKSQTIFGKFQRWKMK